MISLLRQLAALVLDTLRQAWSQKVSAGVFINGSLSLTLLLWYFRTISARGQYSTLNLLSQSDPRYLDNAFAAKMVLGSAVWFAFWSQIFFGLMLMLGLVGPVLAPARNAFVATTPVPRFLILVGRFFGCVAVAVTGVLYPMTGLWIAARLEFGVWHMPFLTAIGTISLALSAMLATMVFLQIAFRSTVVVFGVMSALSLLNLSLNQPGIERQLFGSGALAATFGRLALLLPRTSEIAQWTAAYVQSGSTANSMALWSTALCGTIALAGAAALFSRREF